jgi:phage/plasmid-like protein (TIGR03299 family)
MAHLITAKDSIVLFKDAAWHGLGTVVQEELSPDDAKSITGLDWQVKLIGGVSVTDETARVCTSSRHTALVREDTGDILGIHGKRYRPVQNDQLFDIAYALGDQVKVESAGSLDEGRRIFLTLRGETLNLQGNDQTVPYLALINSHDGSLKFAAVPTGVRVVCNNTLSLMLRQDTKRMYTIRHDGSTAQKIQDMKAALIRFQVDRTNWLEDATKLQKKTVNHTDLVTFWGSVYERIWGKPVTEDEIDSAAATLQKWELTVETERASLNYGDVDLWLASNAVSQASQQDNHCRIGNDNTEQIG